MNHQSAKLLAQFKSRIGHVMNNCGIKSLLISGRCPYNHHQCASLRDLGVDAVIYENWGIHLPHHLDAILAAEPQIVHLQWPESVTSLKDLSEEQILDDFAVALPRLRESGAKLFWQMHNLLPHDRSRAAFWSKLYQLFADHCDVCCHHSEWGRGQVLATYNFPHARHAILRHGYFHRDVFPAVKKAEARERLGLPATATIYLNVGSLRPDKHIAELLDSFEGRKEWLVLAGMDSGEYGQAQAARGESMSNVVVHRGFIDDDKVSLLANSADAFLFMQGQNHLTSGAPHLSQMHLLPQITLDYPYAREVLGEDAVYIQAGGDSFAQLADQLDNLDPSQLSHMADNIRKTRAPWHWPTIGRVTKNEYVAALAESCMTADPS